MFVSEMTYNVSSGTLNPTIPYHTIPQLYTKKCPCIHISSDTNTNQLIQTAKEHVISSFSKYLRNHVFLFVIMFGWLFKTKYTRSVHRIGQSCWKKMLSHTRKYQFCAEQFISIQRPVVCWLSTFCRKGECTTDSLGTTNVDLSSTDVKNQTFHECISTGTRTTYTFSFE